eukprot:COSAG03_NODE_346_length_8784_cov_37.126540_6_plen_1508_part_00
MAREVSDRPPPPNDDVEVRAAEPTPIFVCGAARTHAVRFPAGAALGDLRAAVKRMGYSAAENGLCVVGGAPLPVDDRLTLAQCGIQANSSVQVAGRLLGGVEVAIRGRQHAVDARGRLDLRDQDLGPEEVKEIAAFLATSAGGAVSSLCCTNNPGMVGELDDSGRLKTPDVHAEVFKQLTDSLKISKVTEVDFSSCGIGPVALGHLSDWVRDATAAVEAIAIGGNPITSAGGATLLETIKTSKLKTIDIGKPLPLQEPYESDTLDLSKTGMDPGHVMILSWWLATDAAAAIAHLALGSNPIGDEAMIPLLDTLKDIPLISFDISKTNCGVSTASKLAELLTDETKFRGAVASVKLAGVNFGFTYHGTSIYEGQCWDDSRTSFVLDEQGGVVGGHGYNKHGSFKLSGSSTMDKLSLVATNENGEFPMELQWREDKTSLVGTAEGNDGEARFSLVKRSCVFHVLCDALKTSQVTEIDFSSCGLEPVAMQILSDYVREATGAIASLDFSQNDAVTGKRSRDNNGYGPWIYGEQLEGWTALCSSLSGTSITSLNFSGCELKPEALTPLADAIKLMGAIARLSLSGNPISGSTKQFGRFGQWKEFDLDLSGLISLCESLPGLKNPIHLDLADCGLSVNGVNELGKAMAAGGAVDAFAIGGNPITSAGGATLLETIKTSKLKTIDIGKPLPLQEPYESDTLDLSSTGMDPGHIMILSWWLATDAAAAVTSINCLANKFGEDDLATLLTAIEGTSIRSLCGLTEGQTTADFSKQNLGPIDCKIIAAEFGFRGFIGAINFLKCANNPGMVGELYPSGNLKTPDVHAEVFKQLTDSLKTSKVTEVDFSSCGIGPVALGHLSEWVRDAIGAVASLCCANNPGMVGELEYGRLKTPDVHAEVFKQLTDSLKISKVTEVDFSSCGIGPVALGHLSDWVREATGALTEVNIAFNQIGSDGGIALRDGLKTSNLKFLAIGKMYTSVDGTVITGSQLTTGVTLYVGGRSGEFLKFHEDDRSYAKLKWADDGKESDWMKLNSLDGEPLKLPLQSPFEGDHLDLAHQQLDPGHIVILAWWLTTEFSAAINLLTLDSTGNMRDQKTYTLTAGEKKIDLSQKNLGSADVTLLTSWLQRPEVTGAIAHLALGSNPIGDEAMIPLLDTLKDIPLISFDISKTNCGVSTASKLAELLTEETKFRGAVASLCCANNPGMVGELDRRGRVKTPDVHAEVFKQLTDSLKTSKVTEADFSSCGIGPVALGHVSDWVRDATAAVNSMTVDSTGNMRDQKTYTLTAGEEKIDLSQKNLGSADVTLLTSWLQRPEVTGAINAIVLDECPITGTTFGTGYKQHQGGDYEKIEKLDADLSVFNSLCSSLKSSHIVTISLQKCYLGPQALILLADAIKFMGAIAHLALGSNPIGDEAMVPLLDTLKDIPLISFDISKTNCGVSTASKLAELLTEETKFRGAVACMTLDGNKTIGATGADSLMESICTTRNTQIVKIEHDVGALQLPFQNIVVRTACQIS